MRNQGTKVALYSLVFVFGCQGEPDVEEREIRSESQILEILESAELNTSITDSIQIDQLNGGPPDANLFPGLDPADGSLSANLPTGGPGAFIDWEDLASDMANHRVLDLDNPDLGRDETAFPGSDECVAAANVLSKMDLTYIGVANNTEYAYLLVQRSSNNGDAGYYWLFTKKAPRLLPGGGPCADDELQLVYDLTSSGTTSGGSGDVLVRGHFKPSSEPMLTVYRATTTVDGVPATDAIDYLSGLWDEDPSGVAAVAVNTTVTDPGSWGAAGVKNLDRDGYLQKELIAEAAIPLSVFTGGGACGETYWGSVITRSSGAGGTSPDLKDLARPTLFNFGETTATAALSPSCGLHFDYDLLSATGPDGEEIASPICEWTFSDSSSVVTGCNDTKFVPAGSYSATLKVTDPASGCFDEITVGSVDVYEPLAVDADLDATCTSSFNYDATPSGGSPAGVSYAWTFTGTSVTPPSSTSKSGSVAIDPGNETYTGSVTVTDLRTDGPDCGASDSESVIPYDPLTIYLSPRAEAPTCPGMTSDEVTYDATVGGGNGSYSISWTGATCSGSSCTVGSGGALCYGPITLQATVTDGSGLCSAAVSEEETYQKVTTVTISDN